MPRLILIVSTTISGMLCLTACQPNFSQMSPQQRAAYQHRHMDYAECQNQAVMSLGTPEQMAAASMRSNPMVQASPSAAFGEYAQAPYRARQVHDSFINNCMTMKGY